MDSQTPASTRSTPRSGLSSDEASATTHQTPSSHSRCSHSAASAHPYPAGETTHGCVSRFRLTVLRARSLHVPRAGWLQTRFGRHSAQCLASSRCFRQVRRASTMLPAREPHSTQRTRNNLLSHPHTHTFCFIFFILFFFFFSSRTRLRGCIAPGHPRERRHDRQ